MGDNINNNELRFYDNAINKQHIPYIHIMLSWISDILDTQARILEAKGAAIIKPIFGISVYILAWFADIHVISDGFDLFKNMALSLIGIAMGSMGVVNTYIGMRNRIKKYKEERLPKQKRKDKSNVA